MPSVVIDNGTGYTKMGYSGNVEPQYIVPTAVAKQAKVVQPKPRRVVLPNPAPTRKPSAQPSPRVRSEEAPPRRPNDRLNVCRSAPTRRSTPLSR